MRTHYVYWVRDLDGVLLYIGCTRAPQQRYETHMQKPNDDGRGWFNQFPTKWRLRGPLTSADAYELESQEIAQHEPIFNTRGIKGRSNRLAAGLIAQYFAEHGRVYPMNQVYPDYSEWLDTGTPQAA